MIINLPQSIKEIEQSLSLWNRTNDVACFFDIDLFEKNRNKILYEASLTQWILSVWLKNRNFSINIPKVNQNEWLHRLANSMPGSFINLISVRNNINGITPVEAAKFREKFFEVQRSWPNLIQSNSTFLLCQDSFKKGLPRQLYLDDPNNSLIDSIAFQNTVEKLILSVIPQSTLQKRIIDRADSLAAILHELFKNTDNHATTAYDGKIIGHSLRGIYVRFYSEEELLEQVDQADENEPNQYERFASGLIQRYSNRLSQRQQKINDTLKQRKKLQGILELSIIDSGPGLAAKWAKKDVSQADADEQLNNVLACFKKGYSSVPGGARGFGLWKVLNNIKPLNGMISIRTNGVHAFRQFIVSEEVGTKDNALGQKIPLEQLYDWKRGFSTKSSGYPQVEGSLISVLIPLVDE